MKEKLSYEELRKNRQKKVDNFVNSYMFYAFSDDQFKKGLRKLNTTEEKIISVGSGGFLLKAHIEDFNELNKELDLELAGYIANNENLFNALLYEMWNIEYFINENNKELFNMLGLDYQALTDEQRAIFKKARKQYFEEVEEFNITF